MSVLILNFNESPHCHLVVLSATNEFIPNGISIDSAVCGYTTTKTLNAFLMGRVTPKIAPFSWDLNSHLIMVPCAQPSQHPNSISSGSATFAVHIRVTNTHTHRQTDHATCDICRIWPHLLRCGLKCDTNYPHMPINKVWIYRLLFVCVCVCLFVCLLVCTVTDVSAEDKASGVKFCTAVHRRPMQGISHFCELLLS